MAAYSAMGLGNRVFAVRADIDLGQLESTAVRPVGDVANGIYWFDLSNSTFGINEWDADEGIFTTKTPLILKDLVDLVVGPPYSPKESVGEIGSYAVVVVDDTINGAANFVYYKNSSNAWVKVGSTDWQNSYPTVTGSVTSPTLDVGTNELLINGITVIIAGTNLASIVSAINDASIPGVTAAASANNRLNLFVTSAAESDVATPDGRLDIANETGSQDVLTEIGIVNDVYAAPVLRYGTYVEIPSWRSTDTVPRPTGSVFLKTTAIGLGASLSMKIYSAAADTWTSLAAPLYETEESAIYGLDRTAGGTGISVGTLYVQYDVIDDSTLTYKFFVRTIAGATSITGTVPTSTPSFNASHTVTMRVTQPGDPTTGTPYTFAIGGTTTAAFVAAILAQNIPNVSARIESNGAITITHRVGGTIYLSNASGTALTAAGFTSNTTGVRTRLPGGTELVLSNFAELDYTYSPTEPYEAPADGTLWYYGNPLEVDILVNEVNGWRGYRNVTNDARGFNLQNTNPAGPILAASEPTLQTDGTSLVAGDLWIDTGDLENFPVIYRYDGSSFIAVDNTDAVSQNGIIFADARWDSDGTIDPITGDLPNIASLQESNYIDLDAPSYQLYPRGTLLFNTRRSGYNVKRYVSNLFTESNFPDDSLPNIAATWVTASGNKNNGSPYMGRQAQRRMIVTAMRAAITASTEIREERFDFSLIVAPGYPELIADMVSLNNDRRNTAFVIGDTPLNLPANIVQLTNWSNGISGVYGDGLTIADPFLGVFYPAAATTDVQGNEIVQPASHMALRTFIRSDNVSFQWFAPAGVRRGLIDNATNIGFLSTTGTTTTFIQTGVNQSLRDAMYPININPMTVLPGVGLVCFGQKTRNPVSSALDRINVARLVNYLRTILAGVGNGFLFEPNDKITRDQIKQIVEGALNDLIAKRGISDYLVVCDTSNNTPDRIARNELYVDIAIEPTKAVEFIYIPIRLKNPGDIQALS
jgi:phage tail sheath protein FI